MNNIRVQDNLFNNFGFMANTAMDNYIDSLEEGNEIEFEGNLYIFIKFDGDYVICENGEYFTIKDFHDDLEFGENHKFGKWCAEEKEDEQKEAGILHSKE